MITVGTFSVSTALLVWALAYAYIQTRPAVHQWLVSHTSLGAGIATWDSRTWRCAVCREVVQTPKIHDNPGDFSKAGHACPDRPRLSSKAARLVGMAIGFWLGQVFTLIVGIVVL